MRSSISFLLVFSLITQNLIVAKASDDQVTVESTHSKMRESAEVLFRNVLLVALIDATQSNSSNVIQGLSEILENEGKARNAGIENWMRIFKMENGLSEGSKEKMEQIYNDFKQILNSTIRSKARFEHRIISLLEAENIPYEIAQTFISKLDSLCQFGTGFASTGARLQDFYLKSSVFSINASVPVYGNPQQSGYNGPSVNFQLGGENDTDEEREYKEAGVGLAQGGLTLAVGAAAAAAIGLAVAVVVVAVDAHKKQQESVKVVKEQMKAFQGFATGEDGRRYFKDSCLKARAALSDLLPRMKLIKDGNQNEIDRLETGIDQNLMNDLKNYQDAVARYLSMKSQLTNKYKEAGSKNPDEEAMKELSRSRESTLLAGANKKLDLISLAKLIETSLLTSYRSTSLVAQKKRSKLLPTLMEMKTDGLIETKNKLREMLVALKDLKLKMDTNSSWKTDIDSYEELQFLCDELDVILLAQAELLVSSAFNENVDNSRLKLIDRKAQWKKLWFEAKNRFQDSGVVNALKNIFDYLEELQ